MKELLTGRCSTELDYRMKYNPKERQDGFSWKTEQKEGLQRVVGCQQSSLSPNSWRITASSGERRGLPRTPRSDTHWVRDRVVPTNNKSSTLTLGLKEVLETGLIQRQLSPVTLALSWKNESFTIVRG